MKTIKAPWNSLTVETLNESQISPDTHPFTCPNRGEDHGWIAGDLGALIAATNGWICVFCDYTQDWAYEYQTTKRSGYTIFESVVVRDMVKRIGMTGALTWGGQHLEYGKTWTNPTWHVSAAEMDEWLNRPGPNPARDRAFTLARRLLGLEEATLDVIENT